MKRLSNEEIRELPLFDGVPLDKIKVVTNEKEALEAVKELFKYSVLGFDTESKPTFRKGQVSKGPHLIQLSCPVMTFLFPTRFIESINVIGDLLSDSKIRKVGFGLGDDKKILHKKFGINITNTDDLSVKIKNYSNDKDNVGARAAVAMFLDKRLSKSAQVSNWAQFPLQKRQIKYAANDAYSALCIDNILEKLINSKHC